MTAAQLRRQRIADATIAVLAERGGRGLTHRAVDETAGLPAGSTSYYLRSRADLLSAAVARLAELDAAALERAAAEEDPSLYLAAVVSHSLHGDGRQRTLARYELVLEAGRRPELHSTLAAGTDLLTGHLTRLLRSDATPGAEVRARDVLAFLDGLILANVTRPAPERQSAADVGAALTRVFGLEAVAP